MAASWSLYRAKMPTQEKAEDQMHVVTVEETSRSSKESCCGKKCFVVAVVSLFLFVIFVSLPAGAFLIIHGNRKNLLAFQLGGAMVVSIPIAIAVIFCVIVCFRRSSSSRKLNFNSSAHI